MDFKAVLQVCICGHMILEEATSSGGVIKCAHKSFFMQYHLQCVGLEYSIQQWTCQTCEMTLPAKNKSSMKCSCA
ncbi:hypothetical protein BDQ17DRAFT_1375544 [Cyathus striatus]|nr:hypothetical protein BDQ17DRAFT_1375544 [Cyathus striatus]